MRVVLVSLVYAPDMVSTAGITAGLARELHLLGHEVTVLTSVPHFNPDPDSDLGVTSWRRPWLERVEDGVRVIRCHIPPKPPKVWRRLGGFAVFHTLLLGAALRRCRGEDATVIISPPLTMAFAGLLVRRTGGGVLVYNAQELWPDVPRDLGVIRGRRVLAALDALERWIYRRSDCVVAIGAQFEVAVRARGARDARTIPNFVDTSWITPTPKDNPLAHEWGVADRPVVLYAGNLGLTQDFEALLAAADVLAVDGVQLVIVGNGARRAEVEAAVAARPGGNVQLRAYVPRARVAELYGLADVVVVPLKAGHDRSTLPSKVFSAMAAARPLVVAAGADTDVAATVLEASAGEVVPTGDPDALREALRRVLGQVADGGWDPRPARAAAGRHSPEAVAAAYDDLLRELAP